MLKIKTRFGTEYQYVLKEYKEWEFDKSFIHFIQIVHTKRMDLILPKSEILAIKEN